MNYSKIILKKDKEKSIQRKHPWLFSGAIAKQDNNIKDGDIVEIYSNSEDYLATGYYQSGSIAVKILCFQKQKIDADFLAIRIANAIQYRKQFGYFKDKNNTIFRLINAEGDFLPGLIVDFYANNLVIQFHSVGMYLMKDWIVESLLKFLPNTEIIFSKSSSTLPKNDIIAAKDEFLFGESIEDFFVATENGCKFLIDYKQGQKTGFFIDQMSNRRLVSELSNKKKVLNCFGYTGGFTIAALKGGAAKVDTLDISKRALEICDKNVELNGFTEKHESKAVDVLQYLEQIPSDSYNMIILDPPAFAKHNKDLHQALKGYRTINLKAMETIKRGGLLFTFSCSQAVSKDDFLTMLFSCATLSGREVKIVRRLPHNFDHPQSIFHPEGEYLKGFLLYIE